MSSTPAVGARKIAFAAVKMAVLAPMPIASDTMAVTAKTGAGREHPDGVSDLT